MVIVVVATVLVVVGNNITGKTTSTTTTNPSHSQLVDVTLVMAMEALVPAMGVVAVMMAELVLFADQPGIKLGSALRGKH